MNITMGANLHYLAGSSDKVYNIQLIHDGKGDLYSVHTQWGRRGSTLRSAIKVSAVPLNTAEATYYALYRQKTGKGYKDITHL
jgi:predicted DNA-binding WGR domain protein